DNRRPVRYNCGRWFVHDNDNAASNGRGQVRPSGTGLRRPIRPESRMGYGMLCRTGQL
ncbi:MAG: hypothetical protein AVDCRST_MAG26-3476, partial [uncultured Chloroflexia bacterium]